MIGKKILTLRQTPTMSSKLSILTVTENGGSDAQRLRGLCRTREETLRQEELDCPRLGRHSAEVEAAASDSRAARCQAALIGFCQVERTNR